MNEDNHYLCSNCSIFCNGRENIFASFPSSVLQACYLVPYTLSSGLYVMVLNRILAFQYCLFTQLWDVFSQVFRFSHPTKLFFLICYGSVWFLVSSISRAIKLKMTRSIAKLNLLRIKQIMWRINHELLIIDWRLYFFDMTTCSMNFWLTSTGCKLRSLSCLLTTFADVWTFNRRHYWLIYFNVKTSWVLKYSV